MSSTGFWWMEPRLVGDYAAWRAEQARQQARMHTANVSTATYGTDFDGHWTGDPAKRRDRVPPPPQPGKPRLP